MVSEWVTQNYFYYNSAVITIQMQSLISEEV
jgi:hypothetical protein